ncbi:hypothetical protein CYMTET_20924 [Cymbomonas tetramitiformis]|uniref:Uncharacterized protein n=1 Tax=Cymbomonas tetramitiformis TaxID=36881 RepID=A0AAE0G3B9_9CHLO|nr:hypothetical protein CYMTET_20924 [Cymbomonas tetramitiformis]
MAALPQFSKQLRHLAGKREEIEARGKWKPARSNDGRTAGPKRDALTRDLLLKKLAELDYSGLSSDTDPSEFVDDEIHDTQADTIRSDVFDCWFCELTDLKTKQNLKHAANGGSRGHSARESLEHKERAQGSEDEGRCSGREGAGLASAFRSPSVPGRRGGSTAGIKFLEEEKQCCLRTGVWTRGTHVSRVVPAPRHRSPEPGATKRRSGATNLRESARSRWSSDERGCHITHVKLEAITHTARTFLKELRRRKVLLRGRNPPVVHMLVHVTSRDPALMSRTLMWRMRHLWLLLDLHTIELTAKHIRSEATCGPTGSPESREQDLDDWRLNRGWFEWQRRQWGEHAMDRFASDISAQLPQVLLPVAGPSLRGKRLAGALLARGEKLGQPALWTTGPMAQTLREWGATATEAAPRWL